MRLRADFQPRKSCLRFLAVSQGATVPRANRYILPDHIYHVTHRCHDHQFLLRFARDRNEYRARFRQSSIAHDIAVLTYCITSNHMHMLVGACAKIQLSGMMQQLEGECARFFNRRKKRTGAFWEGRYHCTMVENDEYLWNCMVYIDLNMVRAGVVSHPREWSWCGYQEIGLLRTRYRILHFPILGILMRDAGKASLKDYYEECISRGLHGDSPYRDEAWSMSTE